MIRDGFKIYRFNIDDVNALQPLRVCSDLQLASEDMALAWHLNCMYITDQSVALCCI